MLDALASADSVTWLSIGVKALVYASSLLTAGSVLVTVTLRRLPDTERRTLRWVMAFFALAAAVLSILRLPIQSSFLLGGTWAGATDATMLGLVFDTALGSAIALRLVGLGLLFGIFLRTPAWHAVAAIGALLVAASFAIRGHSLQEPRLLLGALLTAHMLGLAFWIGALLPLYRTSGLSSSKSAGALAEEFGQKALWVVGGLVMAGGLTLLILTGGEIAIFRRDYGQFFMIKIGLFAAVLALAALNKLRLTPALQQSAVGAGTRLRRSIAIESTLIGFILLVTATLTTVSAPEDPIEAPRADDVAGIRIMRILLIPA